MNEATYQSWTCLTACIHPAIKGRADIQLSISTELNQPSDTHLEIEWNNSSKHFRWFHFQPVASIGLAVSIRCSPSSFHSIASNQTAFKWFLSLFFSPYITASLSSSPLLRRGRRLLLDGNAERTEAAGRCRHRAATPGHYLRRFGDYFWNAWKWFNHTLQQIMVINISCPNGQTRLLWRQSICGNLCEADTDLLAAGYPPSKLGGGEGFFELSRDLETGIFTFLEDYSHSWSTIYQSTVNNQIPIRFSRNSLRIPQAMKKLFNGLRKRSAIASELRNRRELNEWRWRNRPFPSGHLQCRRQKALVPLAVSPDRISIHLAPIGFPQFHPIGLIPFSNPVRNSPIEPPKPNPSLWPGSNMESYSID